MELKALVEKSMNCAYENLGRCSLGGYPPLSCENCHSYKAKELKPEDELKSGDLVKITSKTSQYYGTIATYIGVCNGRWGRTYIRVQTPDDKIINLRYDSIERYRR